jgi:hypothetical protein
MTKRRDLSSGWDTYEVYQRDDKGNHAITPFSNVLAASGRLATQAITKMRMVQELGWPEARRCLKDDYGHPLIVKKDEIIWLLKCKPNCWRLYFYVREPERQIIYVYAVCKKANKEDPGDAEAARRVADEVRPGRSGITLFEFPFG